MTGPYGGWLSDVCRNMRPFISTVCCLALALAVLVLPLLRRRRRATVLALVVIGLPLAWTARADIAPPGLHSGNAAAPRTTPGRGTTQPTPATLELVVTDDGSSGILLTHATPR